MNIAFIPVRCGSKSITFKNIKEFCGKPLVYWNLEALEKSNNIDEIFVATDCEEIKKPIHSHNILKYLNFYYLLHCLFYFYSFGYYKDYISFFLLSIL